VAGAKAIPESKIEMASLRAGIGELWRRWLQSNPSLGCSAALGQFGTKSRRLPKRSGLHDVHGSRCREWHKKLL